MLTKLERKKGCGRTEVIIAISLVITLLLIPQYALSISFGSYIKTRNLNLVPGESGDFKILFYSRDEKSPEFRLSLESSPDGFIVTYPKRFGMNSDSLEDEYVLISGEYEKAKLVKVRSLVPEGTKPGKYEIVLKVTSLKKDESENMLNVNAEKKIPLIIYVIEESEIGDDYENVVDGMKDEPSSDTGIKSGDDAGPNEESFREDEESDENGDEKGDKDGKGGSPITGLFSYVSNGKTFLTIISIILVISVVALYSIRRGVGDSNNKEDFMINPGFSNVDSAGFVRKDIYDRD